MIITTLLHKFKDDLEFLINSVESLLFVFSISEEEHEETQPHPANVENDDRINFLISLGVQFEPIEKSAFSRQVQLKIKTVKICAIDYCEVVTKFILDLLSPGDFENFGKLLNCYVVCLLMTNIDDVIIRVCVLIEHIKKTHSTFFTNVSSFDQIVETGI